MIINRLNYHFNVEPRSCLGQAYSFIKINNIEYGCLEPRDFKRKVKESDAVVLLWSNKCYQNNKITSEYIKNEIETLGEELDFTYSFPVFIGRAKKEPLKKGLVSKYKQNLYHVKKINKFIDNLYPFKLNDNSSEETLDGIIVFILNQVLNNTLTYYKPPLNYKIFYSDDSFFINHIMANYKGGIFFRINNKSNDYADILERSLLCTYRNFFATLTEFWFNVLINDDDTSRNFDWMRETNMKAKNSFESVIRILIADKNKSIRDLGIENVQKVYEANKEVEFYFTNEYNLQKNIFKQEIPLYDFALLDEKLIINADLKLVKTSFLNEFDEINSFYKTLIRMLKINSTFEKGYILNKKQIESIIYG